ncbi:MAG: ribose 5-phosphate isomerase B [Armatimonadetes bacterium]|nr:ribose 5-phosphate isomerase B [Armatimonadota bacterium]
MAQKIILGSDHAGYPLRRWLADRLKAEGNQVEEVGAQSEDSYDYPVAADELVAKLLDFDFGILICGSGIGISIRANRYSHVRAALCTSETMAQLARMHNHANVLCLGGRLTTENEAWGILQAFIETEPSEEARHVRRIEELDSPLVC